MKCNVSFMQEYSSPVSPNEYTYNSNNSRLLESNIFLNPSQTLFNSKSLKNNRRYFIKTVLMTCILIITNVFTIFATENTTFDLKSSNNQADYIVITHPDFKSEIDNFVQWRKQKSGLNIIVVDINDIYTQFAETEKAESISDFTSYTMNSWTKPSPRFILLVGSINLIPSKRLASDYNDLGEDSVSIDQWYAINKANNDLIPDIALGRFPARSVQDLQNMVAKTILFEDKYDEINYKYDYTTLTDSEDGQMFENISEEFIKNILPSVYKVKRIYNRHESDFYGNKSDLFNTMNNGTAILNNYVHGAPCIWGKKIIVNCDDIDTTQFSNKPFLLTAISSSQTFDNVFQKGILEKLITLKNGGTFASVASAGLSFVHESEELLNKMFNYLIHNDNTTLGESLLQAFIQNSNVTEIKALHRYSLLGDPAIKIPQKLVASVQLASSDINSESIIYPNPVSDYLYCKSNSLSNIQKIQIYTLEGTNVLETRYNNRIDVSKLVPGVFFIKIGNRVEKFVKM